MSEKPFDREDHAQVLLDDCIEVVAREWHVPRHEAREILARKLSDGMRLTFREQLVLAALHSMHPGQGPHHQADEAMKIADLLIEKLRPEPKEKA